MKLYFTPGACSLAPHIALREAGLRFDLEPVDLGTKRTKCGADFTKVNAKGYVPALALDDGQVLTECATLVEYIADQNPESNLAPKAGSIERYRLREWLGFIASELHKGFGPLFGDKAPESYKDVVRANLAARFGYLDKHLAGKQFLMGSQFTVADAYCFTIVGWSSHVGISLDRWPNLKAYMDRVAKRPNVQATLKAEGLAA